MIYLDSNILIYALEDATARGDRVRSALAATDDVLAGSALVLHECLVQPLRLRNAELVDRYREAYARLYPVNLTAEVFIRAAELRAQSGIRTPDALHLAAAQLARCDALWTNDRRLADASHGLAIDILG